MVIQRKIIALAFAAALYFATPSLAGAGPAPGQAVGSVCSNSQWIQFGDSANPNYIDYCNGSTWGLAAAISSSGYVGIGTSTPLSSLDLSQKTDALALPSGTTAQRPASPVNGEIRYNSSTPGIESYYSSAWNPLGSGAGGGSITLGTSAAATNPQRSGDATTGFFSPATSVIAAATGGLERFRIDSSGNVGIGTTVLGNPLTVANAGTTAVADFTNNGTGANSFYIYPFTDGNTYLQHDGGVIFSAIGSPTPQLTISTGGSVGIGTTSPNTEMHVYGATGSTPLLTLQNTSASNYTQMNFLGTGQSFYLGVGNGSETNLGVANKMYVYDSLHNLMRFVIDNGGRIGIGTTNPTTVMELLTGASGGMGAVLTLNNPAGGPGAGAGIDFKGYATASQPIQAEIRTSDDGVWSSHIIFSTKAQTSSGSLGERMRVTSTGSVGIGTASPAAMLHVNGEAIVASTGLSCSTTTAGALQYASGLLQFCNGTAWQTINAATAGGITPGCGASESVATQSLTTLSVAAGCNVQFKVWGAGGGGGGFAGGGGGYASMTIGSSGSAGTYYLGVGGGGLSNNDGATGGGGPTGYSGGSGNTGGGGGGGSASGVWTGGYGSSGTPVAIAAGGGGSGVYGPGYAAGTGGPQNGSTIGGGPGDRGGGGGGYPTGGAQGTSGNGGYGGTNYAASGGATQTGSGQLPGAAGDANRPGNAGLGGPDTNTDCMPGAVYYRTY